MRTAASRATRWHGLYELQPASDARHSSYDPERVDTPQALSIIARFGDPVPARWLGPCEEVCFEPDPADLRSGWQSARRELGIPVVAPLEVRRRRIRRVGGDTPD